MTEWSCVFCSKVKWNEPSHTPFAEPLLLTQDCLIYRPQDPATVYTDTLLFFYMKNLYRGYSAFYMFSCLCSSFIRPHTKAQKGLSFVFQCCLSFWSRHTRNKNYCFVEEVAHNTHRYKWMEKKRNQPTFLFILQLHCKSPWSFKIGERLQLQVQVRLHE